MFGIFKLGKVSLGILQLGKLSFRMVKLSLGEANFWLD